MTEYRSRHSSSYEDNSKTDELPRVSKLHTEKPTHNRFMPVKSYKGDSSSTKPRKPGHVEASPHAFKHHEAVLETGERPRHSKFRTLLIVIPIVAVFCLAGALGVFLYNTFSTEEEIVPGVAVTVVIPENVTTAGQIASILKDAHVIDDTQAFITDCRALNAEGSLKTGTYELETLMDTKTLISYLVAGPLVDGSRLTIPEGLTVEQTAKIVEEACGISQTEFLKKAYAADQYLSAYPFLAGVYNNSLEGFLFPKTYNIPNGSNADYVIRVLLDQFSLETKGVSMAYAQDHGMEFFHVIILASVIEKETAADEERALVSSVFYNRMGSGMLLQSCATVVYALGPGYDGHPLLYEDLDVDSPYNTYLYDELPAGPICSPSLKSIQAAAQPANTDYLYFVLSSKEGHHTFCETEDEFEAAKEEYNDLFGLS